MVKRKIKISKKRVIKKRPSVSEWKNLYNRLHAEDSDFDVYVTVAQKSKHRGDVDGELFEAFESLITRVDAKIETLQINKIHNCVTYRVTMSWTDYETKPKHGYIRPRKCVVKTSPDLWRGVILCYLELCDQAKRWI